MTRLWHHKRSVTSMIPSILGFREKKKDARAVNWAIQMYFVCVRACVCAWHIKASSINWTINQRGWMELIYWFCTAASFVTQKLVWLWGTVTAKVDNWEQHWNSHCANWKLLKKQQQQQKCYLCPAPSCPPPLLPPPSIVTLLHVISSDGFCY